MLRKPRRLSQRGRGDRPEGSWTCPHKGSRGRVLEEEVIDAHHHIWQFDRTPWLSGPPVKRIFGDYKGLRRDYSIAEYAIEPMTVLCWRASATTDASLGPQSLVRRCLPFVSLTEITDAWTPHNVLCEHCLEWTWIH